MKVEHIEHIDNIKNDAFWGERQGCKFVMKRASFAHLPFPQASVWILEIWSDTKRERCDWKSPAYIVWSVL